MGLITSLLLALTTLSSYDPYGLTSNRKHKYVVQIIEFAEKNSYDPYELLAIAITESSINPKAYSRTKDTGLFQINCKWWYKKFNYRSIPSCERGMLNPSKNIVAATYILTRYGQRYNQCRGDLVYRCYNGGPGWPRSKNKHKIIRYQKVVLERKAFLNKHYKKKIEEIRFLFRDRG